ncbi:hypothetical protein SK36_02586 [Citrobacter sp. MGH106]|nr:hypothetical protein SK36_02586 [Citrobacter sp. MGH106]
MKPLIEEYLYTVQNSVPPYSLTQMKPTAGMRENVI